MSTDIIDFIYNDPNLNIAILVRTIEIENEFKSEYKTCIRVNGITYSCEWILNNELYPNRVEAIIHTINRLYQRFLEQDVVYYKDTITVLSEAMNEAKKLRFQQLDLFENESTRKTYRISKQLHKPSRREDKHRVSIYD